MAAQNSLIIASVEFSIALMALVVVAQVPENLLLEEERPDRALQHRIKSTFYRESIDVWNTCCSKTNSGDIIPNMISKEACRSMGMAAESIRSDAIVVEFGTWIGKSSRCIATGLANLAMKKGSGTFKNNFFAFDAFKAVERFKLKGTKWEGRYRTDSESILPAWREIVLEKYPTAIAVPGYIAPTDNPEWGTQFVDLFVMDAAKDYNNFLIQMKRVVPFLRSGSLIIFGDFSYPPGSYDQIALVYSKFVPRGSLKLVDISVTSSHFTFAVGAPGLSPNDFDEPVYPKNGDFSFEDWKRFQSVAMNDTNQVLQMKKEHLSKAGLRLKTRIHEQFSTARRKLSERYGR